VAAGARVCSMHGGKAPRAVAAAAQRQELIRAEQEVRREVADLPPAASWSLSDVYAELLKTATLAVRWRDALEARVAALGEIRFTNVIGSEQVRGEVALLERAIGRTAKVLELVAKLDVQGRLESLSARQVAMAARVIEEVLTAQGIDAADPAVRASVGAAFRRVGAEYS